MSLRFTLLAAMSALAPMMISAADLPAFLPLPAQVEAGQGRFKLVSGTVVIAPATLKREAEDLAARLSTAIKLGGEQK